MSHARFILTVLLLTSCLVIVGCGGSEPEPAPTPTEVVVAQTPANASTQTPTEAPAQALAAGFTPETVCRVPDLVGEDVSKAESTLAAAGLQPVKDFRHDESVATNAIISQEPAAKTMLEPCEGYVDIVVSLGPPPVPTDTPPPTDTPGPTETPAPPTETPTPLPPTATPTPELVRVLEIDAPVHELTDASPSFMTRFWLDEAPITGSFLFLSVEEMSFANPVWINDILVGIEPNATNDHFMLFVPSSVLRSGENELLIEAGHVRRDDYDNHYVNQIRLDINQASVPQDDEALEIVIDSEIHHLGDETVNEWAVPKAETLSYIKFFELPYQPTIGAVLILKTFSVHCPNPIRINDNFLVNLPGHWRKDWTNDVQIYVPSNYLQAGANSLRIDSVDCFGRGDHPLDDFMMRDIRILIEK